MAREDEYYNPKKQIWGRGGPVNVTEPPYLGSPEQVNPIISTKPALGTRGFQSGMFDVETPFLPKREPLDIRPSLDIDNQTAVKKWGDNPITRAMDTHSNSPEYQSWYANKPSYANNGIGGTRGLNETPEQQAEMQSWVNAQPKFRLNNEIVSGLDDNAIKDRFGYIGEEYINKRNEPYTEARNNLNRTDIIRGNELVNYNWKLRSATFMPQSVDQIERAGKMDLTKAMGQKEYAEAYKAREEGRIQSGLLERMDRQNKNVEMKNKIDLIDNWSKNLDPTDIEGRKMINEYIQSLQNEGNSPSAPRWPDNAPPAREDFVRVVKRKYPQKTVEEIMAGYDRLYVNKEY